MLDGCLCILQALPFLSEQIDDVAELLAIIFEYTT